MKSADEVLMEAWELAGGPHNDDVGRRFEELLPALLQAGYADADEYVWSFSEKGIERIEELERTDRSTGGPKI